MTGHPPRESARNFHNGVDLRDVEPQRMYMIVPYQLKGIQSGIQGGHAKDEYAELYDDNPLFRRWRRFDRTYIVLDGGTFSKRLFGGMEQCLLRLHELGITCTPFYEEDANDGLTGIAFLAPERVWDRDKYPVDLRPKQGERKGDAAYEARIAAEVEAMGGDWSYDFRQFIFSLPLAKG